MNNGAQQQVDRGVPSAAADVTATCEQRRQGALTLKRGTERPLAGRRLLIVTPSYKPLTNPRAFRWSAIAEVWAAQGALVDVVCCWTPKSEKREVTSGVRVIRVGGGISERVRGSLRTAERATIARQDTQRDSSAMTRAFKRLGRALHDAIWKTVYWPDYACLWIPSALLMSRRLLRRRRYDALITVSDPFSAHVVGAALKRSFPGLRWTMDLGDPFSFRTDTPANNQTLYATLNIRTERFLFVKADAITVTSQATADKYCELFPQAAHKLSVIGPLATTPAPTATITATENTRTLVYVGTLYEHIRNPLFLLRLFSAALRDSDSESMTLHFYGAYDGCQRFFEPYSNLIGTHIYLHGLVSHEEALEAMRRADILINLGNTNRYQLPSKLAEYITLSKPIVHLNSTPQDGAQQLLREYPALLTLNATFGEPMGSQVEDFTRFVTHARPPVENAAVRALLARMAPERVAAAYARINNQFDTSGSGSARNDGRTR